MTFTLVSPAFAEGASIPSPYTCDGAGLSPELAWQGAPEGVRSFVLICHDPDSAFGDFTHWVLFDITAEITTLSMGEGDLAGTPGRNGFGHTGYGGPCPKRGEHRYCFELYALGRPSLGLAHGAARAEVEAAMQGHVLAQTRLMGRYRRIGNSE